MEPTAKKPRMSAATVNPIMRVVVGGAALVGFFGTLLLLVYREVPSESRDIVTGICLTLGYIVKDVISWYFKPRREADDA